MKTFFFGDRLKNFVKTFFFSFFGEHLRLCPWSLALASSIPVLGLESVCPRKGCPWPWPRIFFVSLALASSLASSTPPLIFSKFCTINFVENLALMADVLNELTNLSETLQSLNTTIPKANTLLNAYTKRIKSLIASSGEHSILAQQAEKAMSFQQKLREGRSPVINQAQFIRAVADNMEERLFNTASSRAQRSFHAIRRENHKTLVGQIDVLDPEKIDHENPRFGEDEVKSLCGTLRLYQQQTHLAYIEFKASGERSIPDQLNKLMVAIDTLSPSNAECERGFSAMNNIITDSRNAITTNNAEKQFFVSTVRPPGEKWNSGPYV